MGSEITQNSTSTLMAVPEALAAAFGGVKPNIKAVEQTPRISLKGKVWKIVIKGTETPVMTKDEDGEPTPMARLKTIILNHVPERSRAYFENDYVEGANTQPTCWSLQGNTPDNAVTDPQCKSCDQCPQSEKGSKIGPKGEAMTACGSSRRICVIPADKPDFPALLLKLPITSVWEKNPSQEAQGWFAYDAYIKELTKNGVQYVSMVETWMKFDASNDISFPKVLFKHGGFISTETALKIAPRVDSEEVLSVLGLNEKSKHPQKVVATQADSAAVQSSDAIEEAEVKKVSDDDKQAAKVKAEKAAKAKATREAKKAKEAKEAKEDVIEVAPSSVEAVDEDSLDAMLTNWED